MKTILIKDLARNAVLDANAMTNIRGGFSMNSPYFKMGDLSYTPSYDSSIHATQELVQMQSVVNATANGSAFLDGVHATNTTSQSGQNNIFRL